MEQALKVRVKVEAWAEPADGLSLRQLVAVLDGLGHEIVAIDWTGNRVKVLYQEDVV